MAQKFQAIRGMNDLLADQLPYWQQVEAAARELFADYGYREMRVPVVERAELFQRSIGEHTDIVEKEMYSFEDRGGDRLSLGPRRRPASCARRSSTASCTTSGSGSGRPARCSGTSDPQQGRYRQFHQIDCEAFGYPGPDIDAEIIQISARLWRKLGIRESRAVRELARHAGSPAALSVGPGRLFRGPSRGAGCRQPAAPGGQPAQDPRFEESRDASR